jgi:hypothetical protein
MSPAQAAELSRLTGKVAAVSAAVVQINQTPTPAAEPYAGVSVAGIVYLSQPPASVTKPIAAGTNDSRLSPASTTNAGVVKVDGVTIVVDPVTGQIGATASAAPSVAMFRQEIVSAGATTINLSETPSGAVAVWWNGVLQATVEYTLGSGYITLGFTPSSGDLIIQFLRRGNPVPVGTCL